MDFFGIGTTEILMVLVVTLIAFGPSKIPELARHLAKFMKMMREASSELQRQLESQEWAEDKKTKKHTYSSPYPTASSSSSQTGGTESAGYDSQSTYGSADLAGGSSTGTAGGSEPAKDQYSYPYGSENESSPQPPVSTAPKPIDDPNKIDDAQRYAREMTD